MSKREQTRIEEKAAEWALRCEEGLSADEEKDFESWLASNPNAQTQLTRFTETWKRFENLDPHHFEIEGLDTEKGTRKSQPRYSAKRWILALGMAAAIALVGTFATLTIPWKSDLAPPLQTFQYSESDFYKLDDGSTVDLNEGAEVICKYSAERREFWIKSGEAYFTVAKDPSRPFDVYAGTTKLRAIGTEFNVKYQGTAIEVLVTEGIVSLSLSNESETKANKQKLDTVPPSKNLIRRQKAVVHRDDRDQAAYVIEEIEEEKISEILFWKPVTLTFDSTPLLEVVNAFNRYNDNQLVIEDRSIETLQVVATFRSNKLEGFINLLQATSNVVAKRQGDKIILSGRK